MESLASWAGRRPAGCHFRAQFHRWPRRAGGATRRQAGLHSIAQNVGTRPASAGAVNRDGKCSLGCAYPCGKRRQDPACRIRGGIRTAVAGRRYSRCWSSHIESQDPHVRLFGGFITQPCHAHWVGLGRAESRASGSVEYSSRNNEGKAQSRGLLSGLRSSGGIRIVGSRLFHPGVLPRTDIPNAVGGGDRLAQAASRRG